jgi:YebC/PmpR family DNA-binding regulatory protein
MSGHSKWSKIKRQKGSEDARRGQLFTKLGNAIAVAAKNGSDPNMNPSLSLAIDKAKAANMPSSNIERSIKRGTGELGDEQITELLFEGYGPGGIGIIVETVTDNRNRTTAAVKAAFGKNGGNLAASGAVAFKFDRLGVIRVKPGQDSDSTMMQAIESGAEDVLESDNELIVHTDLKELHKVKDNLTSMGIEVIEAEPQYVSHEIVDITDEVVAKKILKLMEAIEELDEVTNTYSNFDLDERLL